MNFNLRICVSRDSSSLIDKNIKGGIKAKILLWTLKIDLIDSNLSQVDLENCDFMKLKIAIIGIGKMGLIHLGIFSALDDCTIVAIVETDRNVSHFLKKLLPKIKIYDSVEKLFSNEVIDFVCIATPISSHYKLIKMCIDKNINFLVEKPFTKNSEEALELKSRLINSKVIHGVGYNRRFTDTFVKAKSIIDSKILGKITSINSSIFISSVFSKQSSWRFKRKISGGGVLLDLGCHVIDLLLWYFGNIKSVKGQIKSIYSEEVEDEVKANLMFENGIEANFECSWSKIGYSFAELNIEIVGSNGYLKISGDFIKLQLIKTSSEFPNKETILYKQSLNTGVEFELGVPEYTKQNIHFKDSVKAKKLPLVNVFECVKANEVVDAIYESARTNKTVEVSYG